MFSLELLVQQLLKFTHDLEKCSHLEDKTDDVKDLTFSGLGQLDGDDEESAPSRQNFWTANLKTEKKSSFVVMNSKHRGFCDFKAS